MPCEDGNCFAYFHGSTASHFDSILSLPKETRYYLEVWLHTASQNFSGEIIAFLTHKGVSKCDPVCYCYQWHHQGRFRGCFMLFACRRFFRGKRKNSEQDLGYTFLQKFPSLILEAHPLHFTQETKFSCLIFDASLTWMPHFIIHKIKAIAIVLFLSWLPCDHTHFDHGVHYLRSLYMPKVVTRLSYQYDYMTLIYYTSLQRILRSPIWNFFQLPDGSQPYSKRVTNLEEDLSLNRQDLWLECLTPPPLNQSMYSSHKW